MNETRRRMVVYLLSPDDTFVHYTHGQPRTLYGKKNDGVSKTTNRCKHHQAYLPRSSSPEFLLVEQTRSRHPSCHPTICHRRIWKAERCACTARASPPHVRYSGAMSGRSNVVSRPTCAPHVVSGPVGNFRHHRPIWQTEKRN